MRALVISAFLLVLFLVTNAATLRGGIQTLFQIPQQPSAQTLEAQANGSGLHKYFKYGSGPFLVDGARFPTTSAGFNWTLGKGPSAIVQYTYRFLVLEKSVILVQSTPNTPATATGVLTEMPIRLRVPAEKYANRFGPNTAVSDYFLDTTADASGRAALPVGLLLTVLAGFIFMTIRYARVVRNPLRAFSIQGLGSTDIERSRELVHASRILDRSVVGTTEFVDGHLVYRKGRTAIVVPLRDTVMLFARMNRKQTVLEARMLNGHVYLVPVDTHEEAAQLMRAAWQQFPTTHFGVHHGLVMLWNNNRVHLCQTFLTLRDQNEALLQSSISAPINLPAPGQAAIPGPPPIEVRLASYPPSVESKPVLSGPVFAPPPPISGAPMHQLAYPLPSLADVALRPAIQPPSANTNAKFKKQMFEGRRGRATLESIASVGVALAFVVPAQFLPAPSGTAAPPKWSNTVKPLAKFVETTRGGAFLHPVPVDLLSAHDFDRISGNLSAPDISTCDNSSQCSQGAEPIDLRRTTLELLGLRTQAPTTSLDHAGPDGTTTSSANQRSSNDTSSEHDSDGLTSGAGTPKTIGFYSPVDKRLYVRGTELTSALQAVLVHELTHAWQDQHFDLDSTSNFATNSDADMAWRALVEADAMYVENAYLASLSEADRNQANAINNSAKLGNYSSYEWLPILETVFPYAAGPNYIKRLRESGGVDAVNAAFKNPPLRIAAIVSDSTSRGPTANITFTTQPDETVLYEEQVDMLTYFILASENPVAPYQLSDLAQDWNGAAVQLVAHGGTRCARLAYNTISGQALNMELSGLEIIPGLPVKTAVNASHGFASCSPPATTQPTDTFMNGAMTSRVTLDSWYVTAAFAETSKTTSSMDRCFASSIASASYGMSPDQRVSQEMVRNAAGNCGIAEEVLGISTPSSTPAKPESPAAGPLISGTPSSELPEPTVTPESSTTTAPAASMDSSDATEPATGFATSF